MQNKKSNRQSSSRSPWSYFPKCHICQGMKQGRGQTSEDLQKLFIEAEVKKDAELRFGKN